MLRVLRAEWRYLAMLHYAVDPDLLTPWLPAGVELDRWRGRAFVSLVGFQCAHTRVFGLPAALRPTFDEVNLRFYVRRRVAAGERRGVVFLRELVPRLLFPLAARHGYGEPYALAATHHRWSLSGDPPRAGEVCYGWRRGRAAGELSLRFAGEPRMLAAGSEAEYFAQRPWGYNRGRGFTREYHVEHPRWRVWPALEVERTGDLAPLCGEALAAALAGPPHSSHLFEGSSAVMHHAGRLPDAEE